MTVVKPDHPGVVADPADARWISDLRDRGPAGVEATRRLRELLLRAARLQVSRLAHQLPAVGAADREDLAQQAADDAFVAVLRRLDDFEGRSRFTTWVYKFGVHHAGVAVRRQAWRHREVPIVDSLVVTDPAAGPSGVAEGRELADALRVAIARDLTPHQRRVAIALLVDHVPIDVLAERLGSSRNALYKTLHDARSRLRTALVDSGHLVPPADRRTP